MKGANMLAQKIGKIHRPRKRLSREYLGPMTLALLSYS